MGRALGTASVACSLPKPVKNLRSGMGILSDDTTLPRRLAASQRRFAGTP
jgi:hypothetical protein